MQSNEITMTLFGNCESSASAGNTIVVFGMTRGGTSMVAGAIKGFGYDLGRDLKVNLEDQDFFFKTDEYMKEAIRIRNETKDFWGWKYPIAADYLDRLIPYMRAPVFVIVSRDIVASGQGLVKWDDREPSAALVESSIQTQKNLMLAIRWRFPTLYVSYEKASNNLPQFISELGHFLQRSICVDIDRLYDFMRPGKYKSFDQVVLSCNISNIG